MVNTAHQILALSGYNNPHPPFGMLLIAGSVLLFGDYPWAWRLSSLFAGFGCIVMVYLISRKLFNNKRAASLAALLFAADGWTVVLSRIATLNSIMLLFVLCSVYFLLHSLKHGYKSRDVIVAGLFLGLALATRWAAIAAIFPLIAIVTRIFEVAKTSRRSMARDLAISLIVCIAIYFATFCVFPFLDGYHFRSILAFQWTNLNDMSTVIETSKSPVWQWPLLVKPVQFYFAENSAYMPGIGMQWKSLQVILAIGNPAVVWGGCAAILFALITSLKKQDWPNGFNLFCFFVFWMIPCIFMNRQKYSYYFYPAMPFLCICLAKWIADGLSSLSQIKRSMAMSYLGITFLMFVFWYPLWTGMPIDKAFYSQHHWMKSWPYVDSIATFGKTLPMQ